MSAPNWWERDIIYPTTEKDHEAIKHAQRVMRCAETGIMDQVTRAHIQGFQGLFGIRVTGILDLPTAEAIERVRNAYA